MVNKVIKTLFFYCLSVLIFLGFLRATKFINLFMFSKCLSSYGNVTIDKSYLKIICPISSWQNIVKTNIYIISYEKKDNDLIIIARPETFFFKNCGVRPNFNNGNNTINNNNENVEKKETCSHFYLSENKKLPEDKKK